MRSLQEGLESNSIFSTNTSNMPSFQLSQSDNLWFTRDVVIFSPQWSSLMLGLRFQYFVTFLHDHRTCPDPTKQYVEWCSDNCNHIQAAIRKNPPSTVEITVSIVSIGFNLISQITMSYDSELCTLEKKIPMFKDLATKWTAICNLHQKNYMALDHWSYVKSPRLDYQ